MSTLPISVTARQLWEEASTVTSNVVAECTPFTLPSGGVLSYASHAITLTTDVVFHPQCTGTDTSATSLSKETVAELQDPFYASVTPQIYVIAAATVIAWILVMMLILTPRTTYLSGPRTIANFGSGRGIIGGANGGSTSVIGVGSRPWLQKVAALTVAISLTIATADTFKVARRQYVEGAMNATVMKEEVLGSIEIRVTLVISDIFLWLAQVQTLIRLFPRHKEKVLIKWIGFVLIVFDSLFSCLNSFMIHDSDKPRYFVDAIPALSYLFELAVGLLYAAWVIYYSATKRRYAFYHSKMKSISLIALLSLIAILTPVVFFVTDVSDSDVAGWGDYFRWVGAAAASVVVWEWVERIEALERDEKKDGILGREIFDGDEMLDVIPSEEAVRLSKRRWRSGTSSLDNDDDDDAGDNNLSSAIQNQFYGLARRFRKTRLMPEDHFPLGRAHSHVTESNAENAATVPTDNGDMVLGKVPKQRDRIRFADGITPPPPVASPISRADTTSAASTVYVVRYDAVADIPQPIRRQVDANGDSLATQAKIAAQKQSTGQDQSDAKQGVSEDDAGQNTKRTTQHRWHTVSNPFKRKRASPPAEVQKARDAAITATARSSTPAQNSTRWAVRKRLENPRGPKAGERSEQTAGKNADVEMPITIIPAQPRGSGRTWSPDVGMHIRGARTDNNGTDSTTHERQESSRSNDSGSATVTANSHPSPQTSQTHPRRRRQEISSSNNTSPIIFSASERSRIRHNHSPVAAVTSSNIQRTSPQQTPPRADDISPLAGSGEASMGATIIVPAPQRRSPLHVSTTPEATQSGTEAAVSGARRR